LLALATVMLFAGCGAKTTKAQITAIDGSAVPLLSYLKGKNQEKKSNMQNIMVT